MARTLRVCAALFALLPAAAMQPRAQTAGAVPAEPVTAANLVYKTTAQFQFAGMPLKLSARTTTSWRLEGSNYEARLHTDTFDFDQNSKGVLLPDGRLAPTSYTEKRPFHGPETVSIDWQGASILFGDKSKGPTPGAGAQDRLSLQFELARERAAHPEDFASGSKHEVHLIGTHDVDPWTFTVGPEEPIDTGRGPMRAVRYSARRMVGTVEETFDIWLGADLHWMPIRIRMVDRHQSVIDSVLQSAGLP
jgi:hypothetical protein